jgi:hypothetical protein
MNRSQNNPGLCVDHCRLDVLIIDEEMGLPREVYLRSVVNVESEFERMVIYLVYRCGIPLLDIEQPDIVPPIAEPEVGSG